MILLCLCLYSLFYHFVNLNFICNNNDLYIRLSFHFIYDTDEEIRDFEIYLSVISNDVILMLLFPDIFKWFFDINIYIKIDIVLSRKIPNREGLEWRRSQLKKKWSSQSWWRKNHVEFPWVFAFGLRIYKRYNKILRNFRA